MADFDLELSIEAIDAIVNFAGYGSQSAPVWFIGFEEGLGKMDSEDSAKSLKARGAFENTMDLYNAHLRLWEGGKLIDIERRTKFTPVWVWMAKIMLARNGHSSWRNTECAKEYIRSQLGRSMGETFLTELSPIPSRSAKDQNWMKWFRARDAQLDTKIKQRLEALKRVLKEKSPPLIICYGSKRTKDFAELLGTEWLPACHKAYKSSDSRCLLLPFFGNGQMSHSVIEGLLEDDLLR